jgi:hypothetical protein
MELIHCIRVEDIAVQYLYDLSITTNCLTIRIRRPCRTVSWDLFQAFANLPVSGGGGGGFQFRRLDRNSGTLNSIPLRSYRTDLQCTYSMYITHDKISKSTNPHFRKEAVSLLNEWIFRGKKGMTNEKPGVMLFAWGLGCEEVGPNLRPGQYITPPFSPLHGLINYCI